MSSTPTLPPDELSLIQAIEDSDGAELYKDDWFRAYSLADKGLITLSSPRGPDKSFMRAELVIVPLYTFNTPQEPPMTAIAWNTDPAVLQTYPRRIQIYGPSYTGRTYLAMTHRKPLYLLHCGERITGTVDEFMKDDDVHEFNFSAGDASASSREEIAEVAERTVANFTTAYIEALTKAKTIVIDTETELWEEFRYKYFGGEKPETLTGTRRDVLWGDINAEWRMIHKRWKEAKTVDLIMISMSSEGYSNNKPTGLQTPKGNKTVHNNSDIQIETSHSDNYYGTITKAGINDTLRGLKLPRPTLPMILAAIYGNDPSNWE